VLKPGSYYDIKAYDHVSRPGKKVLQRAFLALGSAIAAFKQCRPVICIDGTFLTGKYKDTILTVVAADGNNQLLSLAITFAEGENGDSWYWFPERLKHMVVGDVSDVCVIHDRHKGILQAISEGIRGGYARAKQNFPRKTGTAAVRDHGITTRRADAAEPSRCRRTRRE
jgi:hypothetical protein